MQRRDVLVAAGIVLVGCGESPNDSLGVGSGLASCPGAEDTPAQIFAGNGAGFARWLRGDAVLTSSGKVTQRIDLSGNGRHEVPTGSSPNPARQPTYVAADPRIIISP